jgi:AcrR family transcriptional regulator
MYDRVMPKLWNETIEAHRHDVRQALLDTTAALVAEHGLRGVTMSQIAEQTGIGRATLYKYFPDVESILIAWHERQIAQHLKLLADIADKAANASEALSVVLEAYALISHERHGSELAEPLHRGEHVSRAHQHLHAFIRELVTKAAQEGTVRTDVPADELATYCIHSIAAATGLRTKAAVHRLVTVILTGMKP